MNHIGTALVSLHVLEALDRTAKKLSSPGRLTIVSSENHFWCKATELKASNMLAELDSNKACFQGSSMERYNTSKLLNVLWVRELSDRVSKAKLNIVINTVNPGFCASSLHRSDPQAAKAVSLLAWTAAQGGHCLSDAATQHGANPGAYISEQAVKKYVEDHRTNVVKCEKDRLLTLRDQTFRFCSIAGWTRNSGQALERDGSIADARGSGRGDAREARSGIAARRPPVGAHPILHWGRVRLYGTPVAAEISR